MKQIRSFLLAALVFSACGGNVFTLAVGTCFDDSDQQALTSVPEVDCSEPHDNEVFAVFDYTSSEAFPGSTAMTEAAQDLCIQQFDAYVGFSYEDSIFEVSPITPSEGSWESGDREIICALYNDDLSKLTGSMAGAGR